MPIENRNLEPGTRLAAKHKGTTYGMEVVQTEEGIRYRLEDGREFTSPSAAGSAVMNGTACNGWRFWSLAEQVTEETKTPKKRPKVKGNGSDSQETVACGETFPSSAEATEHLVSAHSEQESAE
jgi:hypothetical protein